MKYEYKCVSCGVRFELFLPAQRMKEPEKEPCPECGGKIKKLISTGTSEIWKNGKPT